MTAPTLEEDDRGSSAAAAAANETNASDHDEQQHGVDVTVVATADNVVEEDEEVQAATAAGAAPPTSPSINPADPSLPSAHSHRLNASVWSTVPDLDLSKLELPIDVIPPHVPSLKECAAHQIRALLQREGPNMTRDEEDAIDDGFVMCDLNVVRNKYLAWRRMFPTLRPFFALKCNPDPMVAGVLGQLGSGFDCASVPEIVLALASTDNDPSALIYANPQRAEKDLEAALRRNVKTLTFDGAEELHKVHRIHQKLVDQHQQQFVGDDANPPPPPLSPPDMVLRILVPDKHSTVPLGEKFGVPPGQIEALAELAADLHLPIVGVSFHCGSGNHDPDAYRIAVELAHDASRTIEQVYVRRGSLDHRCWLLDIGGGFPGRDGWGADIGRFVGASEPLSSSGSELVLLQADQDGETARKVAETVRPVLEQLYPSIAQENEGPASTSTLYSSAAPIQFMAEPGRYFVEAAFALCSRIYRVKVEEVSDDDDGGRTNKRQHRHYYIGQGVQGLFKDCVLCGESFLPVPYSIEPDREANDSVPCTIHGPSGEEYDVVCRDYLLPPLEVDDWLIFDRMGAYTLSIAARSGRPAIRYVMGGSQLPLQQP
jgi:ornithine decarboxylase